jgi:hypothetical protein
MQVILITAVVIAVIVLFIRKAGPKKTVILNPKLGFLNLLGDEGQRWLAEDKGSFGTLFAELRN